MREQKVEQRVFVRVGKLATVITPFAVILVEAAVRFSADHCVIAERHAAALAKELARSAEQRVDGNVEFL